MSAIGRPDRQTLVAAVTALILAGIGAALLALVARESDLAHRELAAASAERLRSGERQARAAREQSESDERASLYHRMRELNIVGDERRLDWFETLERIRAQRALPELRYQIAPRRLLRAVAEGPGGVASYASTLSLELALLHEGDLLAVLEDLRRAGNAYHAARRCAIERAAQAVADGAPAARLRARCDIDLITLHVGDAHDGGMPAAGASREGGRK